MPADGHQIKPFAYIAENAESGTTFSCSRLCRPCLNRCQVAAFPDDACIHVYKRKEVTGVQSLTSLISQLSPSPSLQYPSCSSLPHRQSDTIVRSVEWPDFFWHKGTIGVSVVVPCAPGVLMPFVNCGWVGGLCDPLSTFKKVTGRVTTAAVTPPDRQMTTLTTLTTYSVFCDGACSGNGTAAARAAWAWAAWITPTGDVHVSGEPEVGAAAPLLMEGQTNQRAELRALLRALEWCNTCAPPGSRFVIYTDSMYAIKCTEEWGPAWRDNGWRRPRGGEIANLDIIQELVRLYACGRDWRLCHVRGHSKIYGNEWVDRAAVAAIDSR